MHISETSFSSHICALPQPLRVKIAASLPAKTLEVLKPTFSPDMLAYLGTEDPEAILALTLQNPQLKQLVRSKRDGDDGCDVAVRSRLLQARPFAKACHAAKAEPAEARAILRPLLIASAKALDTRQARLKAASKLMRTAVNRDERDQGRR